ncbi:sensor histidine kinase [Clostridium algidicarnis]|uniref:histidine kinase n=2 Tax=Clostridium algidicarnis TaxID=37659 RepID=A0A2S6FX84_9CLOT|nr:HAMP domain-containing sensor histidine kinase [Clostridium algidicarnis]MBB6697671.1 HAMP domain-containing protein [Clostridium algidicarnis]MBU3220843.1 HAMP domain-containing histidine kinase [Clostridium algidicarnis]MCB2285857.1 HAMP domain-containing histidine kinase [Clostridium algidicarnis]PPK48207.1 HAMP domain-containing protein [Clostridium algidicarnis DSM 15099]
MKKNLTLRLFVITSIFISIILILILSLQSIFFEKFYINKKMNTLKSEITKFKIAYSYNYDNKPELFKSMQDFEINNNAKIAIFSNKGEIMFLSDPNKQMDDIVLQMLKEAFKKSSKTTDFSSTLNEGKVTANIFASENKDIKNIVCLAPISLESINDNIIISVSPLQTIKEASLVIKDFYPYALFLGVLGIVFLSIIYSNLISKPLKDINKTAFKMANLDFSEQCTVDREDEIGNLAKTLNFLSLNLNNSLNALKKYNNKLKDDIEKEKRIENMRKDFIANVSHELKTPISLIEGYAEGLKDNIAKEDQKDFYVDVIIDEAHNMESLLNDMLDLSQLESGSFNLHIDSFNIKPLINHALKKFKGLMETKNINVAVDVSDNLVIGDKIRIEQVLNNFISNAIKNTIEKGSISICSRIEQKPYNSNIDNDYKTKDYLFVEVFNTNSNIPKEELNNIWDKFYKIDKSRDRSKGGTGLGLNIVKNILEKHNSVYGAFNKLDGVCFYFSLEIDSMKC